MTKKIIIVGGGYLGAELAKSLENHLDVTLIEQRKAFVHAPAMIRAIVNPTLLDRALMPYDNLLSVGKVLHGKVTSVDESGVTLMDGTRVDADYIVISTGSTNGAAFKPAGDSIDDFRAVITGLHAKLKAASSVAIVGAGTVGSEMAGEISYGMPDKHVTLISSEASLFLQMPPKFGAELTSKLNDAGVDVKFGVRVNNLESLTDPYSGTLELSDGTTVIADLIIPAVGSHAVSDILARLPNINIEKSGRVKVDNYLRPSGLANVFAAGDVASGGDAMTIVAVGRQVPWLTKMLKALAAGKQLEEIKPYEPWKEGKAPLFLPLGPKKGNSFLVIGTFGDWITSMIKGKDLFISKYRKIFGLKG
ncbi:NAD(P)/FAD-dependent oxidoreductase [Psychrobacter fozii]|uniref:NAD(P)/FAD-dependent oxidoreductase n=1 Tax=Psychrobacter fozii TaxID=198480 RepID=UPI00191B50ED|nr:FAD-dependent oxidoreductase [Psychrobacter fozii]